MIFSSRPPRISKKGGHWLKENVIAKRTFRSALIELFEREYKLIGSHKVIELIADDVCQLRDEFYLRSGEEVLWQPELGHHHQR